MKKILTAILTAALLISSAGCQAKQPQAAQSAPEPTPQALVVNVESPTKTTDERIDTSATMEQITAGLKIKLDTTEKGKAATQTQDKAQYTAPVTSQEKAKEPAESLDIQQSEPTTAPRTAASTPAPKQPATEPDAYLKVTVKATPTPPPAATPAPTPEPPAPTPAPAEPTPEPIIEEPAFDIGYWIGYAQSCAQGLGLRLESSAVDCWDNPIGAGPHSTCLERDINSRLNRYASDPDITDVWIWYESTGGNTYNIYIGYA
ncbi:hypothetical protein [Acutalibacter caecimuris]|uniref:hypothetical protein n=1 Tax=Acutalibacter caecimuris TaxID=3093657 RepID=UPI002AC9CF96|nr:hypothetical protein [Acutalibacter sp. M00118]